jgi:hypothetical protein
VWSIFQKHLVHQSKQLHFLTNEIIASQNDLIQLRPDSVGSIIKVPARKETVGAW